MVGMVSCWWGWARWARWARWATPHGRFFWSSVMTTYNQVMMNQDAAAAEHRLRVLPALWAASVVAAGFECVTDQSDNLTLPLVFGGMMLVAQRWV